MNKKLLEGTLRDIENVLKDHYNTEEQIGVVSGLTGLSLFQFYYARYLNQEEPEEMGVKFLELCGEKINNMMFIPTFCSGIAGFGWALEHISQEEFLNTDTDEMLSQVVDYIQNVMVSDLQNGNYDFLHGGVGYGFYFLKRYKNAKSSSSKEKHKKNLFEFIRLLDELSEVVDDDKIRWISEVNVENGKKKVYNLSLSHGMSAIIGILTKLYDEEAFRKSVEKMLKGAIQYVRSFITQRKDTISLFPNWIEKAKKPSYDTRVAWCYGDLGIAVRLLYASKALKDKELEEESIFVLKCAANRTLPENTFVRDAGICHGSFGNALIFQRMYKETNESVFKSASHFWMNDGLEKAKHEDGYVGFKQLKGDGSFFTSVSILEGVAGIGLTIMNHLNEDCADWDECLLIS